MIHAAELTLWEKALIVVIVCVLIRKKIENKILDVTKINMD